MKISLNRIAVAMGMLAMFLGSTAARAAEPQAKLDPALEELRLQAERGDGPSQLRLGLRYEQGLGVKRDLPEAMKWLSLAAHKHYGDAQFSVGLHLLRGELGTPDAPQGMQWISKAADQGHVSAQALLGIGYVQGSGVPKDLKLGMALLHEASQGNSPEANYFLGIVYGQGMGVPQDYVAAYRWMMKAASLGHDLAKQSLTTLESVMTSQQLAEAKGGGDPVVAARR